MKVNSINVTNLNNIFELVTKTKDNKNDNFYLHDMGRILRKSSITIDLDNVNAFELLFLSNYNTLLIEKIESYDINEISKDNIDKDLLQTTVKLTRLLDFVMKEENVYIENNMLPLCYDLYHVVVEFTGNNISLFYKYNIDEWFTDITELNDKIIETIMTKAVNNFIFNFYNSINNMINKRDSSSLIMEDKLFTQYANKEDKFTLHEIIGPYGTNVEFINSDTDKLSKQMSVFNTYYNEYNNDKYKFLVECETTLQTMIELSVHTKLVDSYEHPILFKNRSDFYVPTIVKDKYTTRFSEILTGYEVVSETSTDDTNMLEYMYKTENTYVKYSMIIPFSEIKPSSKLCGFVGNKINTLNIIGNKFTIETTGEYQKLNDLLLNLRNINVVKF